MSSLAKLITEKIMADIAKARKAKKSAVKWIYVSNECYRILHEVGLIVEGEHDMQFVCGLLVNTDMRMTGFDFVIVRPA